MKADKKSPLWDGTPQRTGGISRTRIFIISDLSEDRKGVAQYG